ncbi:MAG: hypothetical protein ACLPVY_17415 [Acidimicrobiia bacterium]
MAERPVQSGLRALRAVHDRLWDPDAELVRVAPGVNPDRDLSAWQLHAVRETALGAVVDLRHGQVARAATGIRSVLANQYREEGVPWSGTFKVCAEEADPPAEHAQQWLHYDPNWRQFLGCILAYTVERYADVLPPGLGAAMQEAIGRCVRGEPHDRIPDWYTNPNLLHAWLESWMGVRCNERHRINDGENRLRRIMDRFERHGDIDEYNSPTYDGIDLFAAALWVTLPPTPQFEQAGTELATHIGARLGRLYHPGLAAICGPYIRAYGMVLHRYVSLAGQWLALAGADMSRVLPPRLDEHTTHVHDLYFLEMFDDLADAVVPHIRIEDVDTPRRHEQRFGDIVAVSYLDEAWAVGAERGRLPTFAKDQYVPFTAHFVDGTATAAVGVKLGDTTSTIDVYINDALTVTLVANGTDRVVELLLVCSDAPTISACDVRLGSVTFEFSAGPSRVETVVKQAATELRVSFDMPQVTMTARRTRLHPSRRSSV